MLTLAAERLAAFARRSGSGRRPRLGRSAASPRVSELPAGFEALAVERQVEARAHDPGGFVGGAEALVVSLYSALITGLPAARYGSKSPHSEYWLHCSVSTPSKLGSIAPACSPSFFCSTAIPSPWTLSGHPQVVRELLRRR